MYDYTQLQEALIDGDEDLLLEETDELLNQGAGPVELIAEGMMPAMEEVGNRFSRHEMYVPEVLMCANAMNRAVDRLRPLMEGIAVESRGKVVIGTVKGDLHDIGKNLVTMFMEVSGFEVLDLGVDVAPDRFIGAVRQEGAQVIAMSALLTTTVPVMEEMIRVLEAEGLRDQVKVIVGGAPITQEYADGIGADGYARDAAGAVRITSELLSRA